MAPGEELTRRLALCDKQTRETILLWLRLKQSERGATQNVVRIPDADLVLDESDPIVATQLQKCTASRFFDDDGRLRRLPDR